MGGRGAAELTSGRRGLAERLRARRAEIEEALLTRTYAIDDPSGIEDPAYAEGLRATVGAALDYALEALERGEERTPPPPPALLAQARLAARVGVGLDAVLRRYFAGYAMLGAFLIEEAAEAPFDAAEMKGLLRGQAAIFDRLIAAITEEHGREATERHSTSEQRRAERVERLLAGELVDTSELAYDLDAHHLGLLLAGPDSLEVLGQIATELDRRLLAVRRNERLCWAWFGGRRPLDPNSLRSRLPPGIVVTSGEPCHGLPGWRLTHQQAAAAFAIAQRRGERFLRYADVVLLSAVLRDEFLASSLRQLYLEPLKTTDSGGSIARETLRAYFAAERNVSSAAAALGVNRNTVGSRLRAVEAAIGRPISTCVVELDIALSLAEIDA